MELDNQIQAQNELKSFIKYNYVTKAVSVDFDSMCVHLMRNHGRMFSPAEFERALTKELEKIKGLPVNPVMFDEIAAYVNNMTIFMHQQSEMKGAERNEGLKTRFEEYTENLARQKK